MQIDGTQNLKAAVERWDFFQSTYHLIECNWPVAVQAGDVGWRYKTLGKNDTTKMAPLCLACLLVSLSVVFCGCYCIVKLS